MAPESDAASKTASTQNTQYDKIGTNYNKVHVLPAVEPERPSVIAVLGDINGAKCIDLACGTGRYTHLLHSLGAAAVTGYDISSSMVDGAKAAYPASEFPSMNFAVADCSKPLDPPAPYKADVIFAGWFLNYAGTEHELVNMFKVIEENLGPSGRFVGVTTNPEDPKMHLPKIDFYGLDIEVLNPEYKEPGGEEVLGIKARVIMKGAGVQFDVYEFKTHVYERCAKAAGLKVVLSKPIMPDDERKETDYWNWFLERPTHYIVTAERL